MSGIDGDRARTKAGGLVELHCGFAQKRAMRAHTLPTSHSQQLQAAHKDHTPSQRHVNVIPNFSLLSTTKKQSRENKLRENRGVCDAAAGGSGAEVPGLRAGGLHLGFS